MKKTLYISDLDGTLLGADSRLSAASVALLNHAVAEGVLFSVATARTPATVSLLLKDVDIRIPMVVMTGASLWDKNSGLYSEVQYFHPDQVRKIIGVYSRPEGGGGFLYTLADRPAPGCSSLSAPASPYAGRLSQVMEIYHIGPLNKAEREFMEERVDNPFKVFFVPSDGRSEIPPHIGNAVLFFGMKSENVAREIRAGLHKIPGINPMFYYDWHAVDNIASVEAFPEGATKAQAIQRLKRLVGADRVVVFGDNMNDLSMMAAADWSVAVSNALPEVKRAADEVIGPNTADAVPRYILEDFRRS